MEILLEIAKIVIPAALVLYAMYLTVRAFIQKDLDQKRWELAQTHREITLPLRLQAYERLSLLIERISPTNLLVRVNDGSMSARELQARLLHEIREEFQHNLSQQVYVSNEAWELVKNAREDLVMTINAAAGQLGQEATGTDLARSVLESSLEKENDALAFAQNQLKEEARQLF